MSSIEETPVTSVDDEGRRRAQRAEQVALWRYQLIRDAADPDLSTKQRGRLVRTLANTVHKGPFGVDVVVSRATLDRWIKAWRTGGFDALLPPRRQVTPRTAAEVLELATGPDGRAPQAFGRFEAPHPNDRWVGDALHGPVVAGRKTFLFCFVDDHSRAVMGARWGYFEDTVRLAVALRRALAARGVPRSIYVDNGSAFVDAALKRAAAKLAIRIIHSTPGRPQGRGKIERFFETVRGQFLVEVGDGSVIAELDTLNRLFLAWVETVYHLRTHSESRQSPLERWLAGAPFAQPTAQQLYEAFLWQEQRQVRKTATVNLLGNAYCVDPVLVGRRVELVFDPFDLTHIQVRHNGKPMGLATPQVIGRHAHPKARPEHVEAAPPAAQTGIDYLRLVAAAHDIAAARRIDYRAVTGPPPDEPTPAADIPGSDQDAP